MDFDLEIINEEDDCPNHLFESIMNAVNSMKEATADKIYQKIQREGETSYSKPQVDKALANALKYGIFEVKNNRYKMRDDIIDDEDTVGWKLNERKHRTPFRIQQRISERQFGLKLDPERDNQRFRKFQTEEIRQCPHCGRIKKLKPKKKHAHQQKKLEKLQSKERRKNKKHSRRDEASFRIPGLDRGKEWKTRNCGSFTMKKKKQSRKNKERDLLPNDKLLNDFWVETQDLRGKESFDSRYSNLNFLEAEDQNETKDNQDSSYKEKMFCPSEQLREDETNYERASESKSDTESERSSFTSPNRKKFQSHEDFWDSVTKIQDRKEEKTNKPTTPRRSQYLAAREVYDNEYESSQMDQHKEKSDWLGHPEEPQGTIIQTNNVLTIEPMDSLAFKSQEQASYIT